MSSADAAARIVLRALQHLDVDSSLLHKQLAGPAPVLHVSLALPLSPHVTLVSGNLLDPLAYQPALLAGNTLAKRCMDVQRATVSRTDRYHVCTAAAAVLVLIDWMQTRVAPPLPFTSSPRSSPCRLSIAHLEDVQSVVQACPACHAIACLPIMRSAAAAPIDRGSSDLPTATAAPACLGALILGYRETSDVSTAASLRPAQQLAHALSHSQGQALADLSTLLTTLLLPKPREPPPPALRTRQTGGTYGGDSGSGSGSSSGSDDEGDEHRGPSSDAEPDVDGERPTGGEGGREPLRQRPLRRRALRRGGGGSGSRPTAALLGADGLQPPPPPPPPHQHQPMDHLTLRFACPHTERAFAAYHSAHMRRVDACAYLICLAFYWCVWG